MGIKFPGFFFFLVSVLSGGSVFAAIPITPSRTASPGEVRSRVLAAAEQYHGTPYRYGGMDYRGLDCSGLIYRSFRDALGIEIPRTTAGLHAWAEPIPEADLMPGDLVFFNTTGPLSHVGLYAGGETFIHAASSGQKTGVIYSRLSETYWKRTFAGAGRALPPEDAPARPAPFRPAIPAAPAPLPERDTTAAGEGPGRLYLGFGLAPSWSGLGENNLSFGGAAAQAGIFTPVFSLPLRIGLEIRPQWDAALHVFRLPLTVSVGFKDIIRVFAGPAFTVGTPVLNTPDGKRRYTEGNGWLGEIGVSAAPVSFELPGGALAVYGEIAWQSYVKDPSMENNWQADVGAALRVSTGLRYVLKLR
ncbi:MAG: C40 family peptidase [Spirochaetaceae bacterium]|jgi:probable lipoprotein NlpC|nr:C40 family peptidase [Spirochaetaceae bacterium]